MPNSEYLRLKALLDSNPQYKIMLDTISKAEGTWGTDAYSTAYGGKKIDWRKGKDKTVRNDSSAHGKYQFMNETWFGRNEKGKHIPGLQEQLELSGFSPEEQDVAALKLLEDAGSLKHIDNGEWDKAIFSAAPTWAALPKNEKGESALKFKNGKPQLAKPLTTVLRYAKSNEAARAAVNDDLKKLNETYTSTDIQKEKADYLKEIRTVNAKKISDAEKNLEKHAIKQKYYREGKLMAINKSIVEDNRTAETRREKINKLQTMAEEYNSLNPEVKKSNYSEEAKIGKGVGSLLKNASTPIGSLPLQIGSLFAETFGAGTGSAVGSLSGSKKTKADKELIDLAKELGIELKYKTPIVGYNTKDKSIANIDIDALKTDIKKHKTNYSNIPVERGILKYGKTKDEYDAEVDKNTPADTGVAADIENGTTVETPEEKKKREQAEADQKKKDAEILAAKNKPFEGSDILDKYNTPEEWADPQFQYSPGKAKIPFDALIGLTTGLVGAAEADDVEIKYRDEQISEGMLLYAQDLAKIKNMGLPPEIEGGLKMKLQDAYQTGLENIVRASNGNRNLVLGNQGQLDKARMSGLVEIAAMDIERSDKAMAAFGEVQQYINEFDSKRDIANNERKYQEDQKRQMSGMQLAQQGMSSFIDAIQNAKENAPGSVNDMKRQYFQFATTGLLPNAKPGEIGSPEYKEAKKLEREIFKGKKQTYADWINTKTMDEKDIINNILKKNPQMDLMVNGKADFEELKSYYDKVSGTDEYKSEYQKSKGISELTTTKIDETSKEIKGEKPAEEKVVEKQHVASKSDPITFTKEKYPVAPTIVTTEKISEGSLLNQLVRGANGQETGINTLERPSLGSVNQRTAINLNVEQSAKEKEVEDFRSLTQ